MIAGLIQVLTQFFFFLAAFIMLPVTVVSLIYGKLVGQIQFRVEEVPSLFEQKKPNPSVKEKMPWEEEQRRLLGLETTANSPSSPSSNKELSVKDFGPTGELREQPKEEQTEETAIETEEEEKPEPVFTLANNELEVEIAEDVEQKTKEGIPIKLIKGTKIKIAKPGSKPSEETSEEKVSDEEKKKKIKKLEEDPNLGVIG